MEVNTQKVLFKETQRITHWYIYLPLAGIMGIILYAKTTGEDILVPFLIILGLILLFLSYKMTTTVTADAITIKMSWFGTKKFAFRNINHFIMGRYSFIGYGYRVTTFGRAYNVKGNKGVLLLHKGKKVLIGTQKEQELYALLSALVEAEQLTTLRETETVQQWLKGNK